MTDWDARIWQAVIAGVFIGSGWFVNGWLDRRAASALRREKLRDMHRAIYAEIGNYLANLWDEDRLQAYADAMLDRMRADAEFIPFIPREKSDTLFEAFTTEIHVLPRYTIDPIVAYYSQVRAISSLIDDMRGDGFKAMTQDRRMAMYADYIEMKKQALQFGRYANAMITAYAEGGADRAKAEAKRFSNPVADPSDRSQG
ncbi:hypothetical protein [Gymnodinialimonas hymeniacidonis]|uniref:hypothetical protein n=1 Tax=Gymnodinialimonas hymeniacidonis TaxID=3126508 RepID=UPI0034C6C0B5